MELVTFTTGPLENNSYLAYTRSSNSAVLFDAPIQSFNVVKEFVEKNQLNLRAIILTHTHFDHITDLSLFRDKFDPQIYVHPDDEYRLLNPMDELPTWIKIDITPVSPTHYLQDEEILVIQDMNFRIIHTPGHTPGGVCIELLGQKKIITGDTLFNLGIGRTDFHGGNSFELLNSIKKKLLTYPDDFEIYPGHGGKSTIGIERIYNPFLKKELN